MFYKSKNKKEQVVAFAVCRANHKLPFDSFLLYGKYSFELSSQNEIAIFSFGLFVVVHQMIIIVVGLVKSL